MKQRHRFRLIAIAVVAIVGLAMASCAKAPAEEGSLGGQDAQPAKLIPVPGSTLQKVVLTPPAAKQIGVETAPVQAVGAPPPSAVPTAATAPVASPSAAPVMTTIPVTAVIYDPEGKPWTYTIPAKLTYLRVPIVVDHVDGNTAYLSSGPPVGTPVVSQGAPELLGAEYGVGEE
jgi:hypothetical protein